MARQPEGADRPCPACGSPAVADSLQSPAGRYVVCGRCGTAALEVSLDPRTYYEDYFPAAVHQDSPVLRRRYEEILRQMEAVTSGRRLLEVGCGNGQLLVVAQERGWSVAGTELSRAQVEHGRARDLEVVYGDLAAARLFGDRTFDAVILIEVLEHLSDPGAMLSAVAERMAPGAGLYATTPNFDSLSRRLIGQRWSVLNREHLTLFTPAGLSASLRRAGLARVSVRSRNVNPAEILHHVRKGSRPGPRRSRAPGRGLSTPESVSQPMDPGARVRTGAALRDRIEASRTLRAVKHLVNAGLALTGLGDTLIARAAKPRPESA